MCDGMLVVFILGFLLFLVVLEFVVVLLCVYIVVLGVLEVLLETARITALS